MSGSAYTVTVFGSGEPPADVLTLAFDLGQGIALRGWTLKNGGYGGTMAAAARGAREAGGKVVGVTCRSFARPGGNPYSSETVETGDLFERLARLIDGTDAFAALLGGTGTMTEVFLTWELMVKGFLPPRPLCLVGTGWGPWWRLFAAEPELGRRLDLLSWTVSIEEALETLAPREGGRLLEEGA